MDKDKLYLALYEFKNLSMDTQGQVTNKLHSILDMVTDGVWNKIEGGMKGHFFEQCTFCCVSPENEHADWCPVRLARELRDELCS